MAYDAARMGVKDISIGQSNSPVEYLTPKHDWVSSYGEYIPIEDNKVIIRPSKERTGNWIHGAEYSDMKLYPEGINYYSSGMNMINNSLGKVDWQESIDKYFPTPSTGQ
jgi:hypothetical protein